MVELSNNMYMTVTSFIAPLQMGFQQSNVSKASPAINHLALERFTVMTRIHSALPKLISLKMKILFHEQVKV